MHTRTTEVLPICVATPTLTSNLSLTHLGGSGKNESMMGPKGEGGPQGASFWKGFNLESTLPSQNLLSSSPFASRREKQVSPIEAPSSGEIGGPSLS